MPLTSGKSCTLISWVFLHFFSRRAEVSHAISELYQWAFPWMCFSVSYIIWNSKTWGSPLGLGKSEVFGWVVTWRICDSIAVWIAAGSAWSWNVWGAQESCHGHCKGRVHVKDERQQWWKGCWWCWWSSMIWCWVELECHQLYQGVFKYSNSKSVCFSSEDLRVVFLREQQGVFLYSCPIIWNQVHDATLERRLKL